MFLDNNFILGNEIAEKVGFHIANISILKKDMDEAGNVEDVVKMGNCNFINIDSLYLPKYIKIGIQKNTFTDMSNKLPCTFAKEVFEVSDEVLEKSEIVKGKVKVSGKDFYEFTQEFIDTIEGKVVNILDYDDTMECYRDGQIDGYIKLKKNKFITWY